MNSISLLKNVSNGDVFDADRFNSDQTAIETAINKFSQSTTDGDSGADNIKATAIADLSGTTIQALLESLRDKLKSTTDSSSGADFVNATAISGLTGTTVQSLLESIQTYHSTALDTHKSSTDHDSRYISKTNTTEFTPSSNFNPATKKYVDDTTAGIILGQIPDNSLTNAKLATDVKIGSLASLSTTEKNSVVGAINELVTSISNSLNAGVLENSLQVAKGMFTVQSSMASGLNILSKMAIDSFNDESGIASKTNQTYDSTNKLYKPTITRTPKTVTANGNAQISIAQKKFGTASAYFDGTGDYLSIPDSDDWNYGSGDFTIECWIRTTSIGTFQEIISQVDSGGYKPAYFAINSTGKIVLYASSNGSSSWDIANGAASTSTISINTWYHIALVRNSNTIKVYLNGVEEISVTSSSSLFNANGTLRIGSGNGGNYFIGYIDEVRISKGIARWTSAFTPPTDEYSTDQYTVLLLHCNGANASTTFYDSQILSMTLISNALTCASSPSNGFIVADDISNGATITYYLSRDNGTTWTQGTKDTLVSLTSQPSGTSLKVKVVTNAEDASNPPQIKAWAFGYQ